jgi:hypothetical protein
MSEWDYGPPPNETIVEVELDGDIIRVKAFYGRDGTLPHWKSEDESVAWSVNKFDRWRHVST